MKVLASLRKRTKKGVSVWCFCYDAEMKMHYAVGGETPKVINADNRAHLKQVFDNFVKNGYTRKLPKVVEAKQKLLVADPWQSELPLEMQHELAALA